LDQRITLAMKEDNSLRGEGTPCLNEDEAARGWRSNDLSKQGGNHSCPFVPLPGSLIYIIKKIRLDYQTTPVYPSRILK
jgi:hypothetical protein